MSGERDKSGGSLWSGNETPRPPRLRDRWFRVRLILVVSLLLILVAALLDFVLVYVLPLPPEAAALSRSDVLLYSPVALLLLLVVVLVELRPVSSAVRTLGLGLRLSEVERRRALRTALSFPVVLPTTLLLIGTAGNLISFGLDLVGRTPWLWYAVHTTVVAQCIMVAGCFPVFVTVRSALRPFILAMGGERAVSQVSVGLRGRIALMVVTLAVLITVPSVSFSFLQLDAQTSTQREHTMRDLSESLAREAQQMGLYSFTNFVRSASSRDGTLAFVVDARGGVVPPAVAPLVRRARLPPPRAGRAPVVRVHANRHLVVSPVPLENGEYAWVGLIFSPRASSRTRAPLVVLLVFVLGVATLLSLVMGAGLARELRAISGRLQALAEGRPPEPLPGDVGATAEIGRVIDGINALLSATDRAKIRGFVEIEQSEEAARSKTEFLANMSHDLRSPLTAIIGFADFLSQGMSGPLTEQQRVAVARILGSALTLQHTIVVLLDTAKLEAGRLKFHRSWTPPATLVSRAVKSFSDFPQEAGRRPVKVEVQPGLPPIHVDLDRAAEALALLLGALTTDHSDAHLYLRAHSYRTGVDSGVELEVGDMGGKPLRPEGEAYFSQMIPEGSGGDGHRGLRLAPYLAAQLIRRQRGRVGILDDRRRAVGFRVSFPLALTGEMPALREP